MTKKRAANLVKRRAWAMLTVVIKGLKTIAGTNTSTRVIEGITKYPKFALLQAKR